MVRASHSGSDGSANINSFVGDIQSSSVDLDNFQLVGFATGSHQIVHAGRKGGYLTVDLIDLGIGTLSQLLELFECCVF